MNTPTVSRNSFNPFSLFSKTPQKRLQKLRVKKQKQRIEHLFAAFKLQQDLKNLEEQLHWLNYPPYNKDPKAYEKFWNETGMVK